MVGHTPKAGLGVAEADAGSPWDNDGGGGSYPELCLTDETTLSMGDIDIEFDQVIIRWIIREIIR